MTTATVAQTILEQLGGRKFLVMTGARDLMSFDNGTGLQFKLPRYTGLKINFVRIKLDPSDTYTVEFGRVHGLNYSKISEHEGIYCDMLQDLFTSKTGLDTHL
jgi:hypothetical protein